MLGVFLSDVPFLSFISSLRPPTWTRHVWIGTVWLRCVVKTVVHRLNVKH